MASAETWLELLAWTKTLFEATTATIDFAATLRKHRQERDTIQEAARVSVAFSSYSEEEVQALLARMQACRDRFVEEGSGAARAKCICSVLNDAATGNGGALPLIDDWRRMYAQLKCAR